MDEELKKYLEERNIEYIIHVHPAVFTVEEALKLKEKLPKVKHTKNLFLKDESKPIKFFLVSMDAHSRLDLKKLAKGLKVKKKLSFGNPEQLKEKLNLTPGSVSIFGMIHAKPEEVTLILDKEVWEAEKVGFHPNINISTLELTHENLSKFYNSLRTEKHIMELPLV